MAGISFRESKIQNRKIQNCGEFSLSLLRSSVQALWPWRGSRRKSRQIRLRGEGTSFVTEYPMARTHDGGRAEFSRSTGSATLQVLRYGIPLQSPEGQCDLVDTIRGRAFGHRVLEQIDHLPDISGTRIGHQKIDVNGLDRKLFGDGNLCARHAGSIQALSACPMVRPLMTTRLRSGRKR